MKHPIPLQSALNLAIIGCLLALGCGLGRAQAPAAAPIAERLDVYFGKTTLQTIDGAIDSYTVEPDNIIKVEKSDSTPNQLSIVGLASGSAMLTVKSEGRTLLYDVAVSIAPERLYINLNESKRLTFPNPIDDTSVSQPGIVHVVQPDTGDPATADKVLLVEADVAGKTTLTVTSKGSIYRYFISTFDNRGADILEIQNDFSQKGYRSLTITFDKDQAIIGGTVPTQEELDDAVRIVKQFTQFVVVKATLGQAMEESEYSEQEAIIINNIQRIANVKGLIVRVKFPLPTVITTSTYTKSSGDYISPATTTTPQGGSVRGSGFQPPTTSPQGPNGTGPLEPKPQQNTTEQVTTTENTSIPEKIFLYGDMEDDLDEARVLRVARTFCPFVVNLMTIKDPIQLRTSIRFMQVSDTNSSNIGFDWSNNASGPTINLGFGGSPLALLPNPINVFKNFISANPFNSGNPNSPNQGVVAAVNAGAVMNLFESLGVTRELREADLFLTNGQPGWYSEGEVKTYIQSSTTTLGANNLQTVTLTTAQIFLGLNMDIAPLNLPLAGGTDPQAQKILGVPGSLGAYTVSTDSSPSAAKVDQVGIEIQKGGAVPLIDDSVKYVDENGLIGMNISTQLSLPGAFQTIVDPQTNEPLVTLPDVFVRTTRTRVNLRDGQTVAIDGLIDRTVNKTITDVPFLSKIPIFSTFFKMRNEGSTGIPNNSEQVIVLVTPHIVRMRDPDSSRYPKPYNPEMQDMAREFGDVPIIKPVRYDAAAVDLRPEESPKDMKEAATPSEPPGPTLHATGGMQTLQPPAESAPATPSGVDNSPPASDISRQPSSAPLAPSSTLP
jgi:Flp pilus assembly secretin CpaC